MGVRICGSLWYNPYERSLHRTDKYEGRTYSEYQFKRALVNFVTDGRKLRRDVVKDILKQLRTLRETISRLDSFRFYSR